MMSKNYSLYILGAFLGLGSIIGLAFPYVLHSIFDVPEGNLLRLQLWSLIIGWLIGAINFSIYYFFIRHIIRVFRGVLARVRAEDYYARIGFSGKDILGLLADDVNATLSHLEEKNNEVLHDELTGLPNRYYLKQYYRKNSSQLTQRQTAFLFFDLDKFKEINDRYGHQYGDRVLVEVSDRVSSALTEDEFLVRLSGDEFLLVAKLAEGSSAKELAEQLTSFFLEPFDIYGTLLQVQTSIGVSIAPAQGMDLAELIRKADFAMYRAKKKNGLSYHLFEEQQAFEESKIAESH